MLARPARALRLPGSARGVSTWQRALPSFMFKQHIVASDDYNRWLVPPAAIGTHMCIGSVYAWSIFNGPLTRELGVVCSSASDWQLGYVVPVFSTSIVALGLSAATLPRFPRKYSYKTQDERFVAKRREELEEYLAAVVADRQLRQCAELHQFLELGLLLGQIERGAGSRGMDRATR